MDQSLFRFIWSNSRRPQLLTLAVSLGSLPLLYLALELPKTIINEAISGEHWPRSHLGHSIDQLPFLSILCFAFIFLVALNAYIRHRINVMKAGISVLLLHRLRQMLVARVLRFPLPEFKKVAPGEIASMVISEVAPFGRFFGDSIAVPVFEGALFATILAFVFAQDFYLGIAAAALVPIQALLVPRLQRRVNELTAAIMVHERELSNRITEVVEGVKDVHAQDGSAHVLAGIGDRLTSLSSDSAEAAYRASFLAFCNTVLGQVTPFFFYLLGGGLVIAGDLSFGALVAALAAHRDLAKPWEDLLDYYREFAEARTKFDVVLRQFTVEGMRRIEIPGEQRLGSSSLVGPIEANGLGYVDEDGRHVLDNVHFHFGSGDRIVILSDSGNTRDVVASILSRLCTPSRGSLRFAGCETSELHASTAGTCIALLDSQPTFFNTSVGENLYFGLSSPTEPASADIPRPRSPSRRPGPEQRLASLEQPWVNPQIGGLADRDALRARTLELLRALELEPELYSLGLSQDPESARSGPLGEQIVAARADVRASLARLHLDDLIQPFDVDRFNTYSTVAENILFGEAGDENRVSIQMAASPIMRRLLRELDLDRPLFEIGLRCAETLVELLRDLPAGHPFFEQYNLVTQNVLPDLAEINRVVLQRGVGKLSGPQRCRVMSLTFGIAPQRHRLGLIDQAMQKRLVDLRHLLRHRHPELVNGTVRPYDVHRYIPGLSILSNLVFGRIMFGRAHAETRVIEVVDEVIERRGLRDAILLQGLEANVGVGGRRLSVGCRQKLGVARNLLKRPDVVVVNDMLSALDRGTRARLTSHVIEQVRGATLIWLDSVAPLGIDFDMGFRIEGSQLSELDHEKRISAIPSSDPISSINDPLTSEAAALRTVPFLASLDWPRLKLLAFTSQRREYRAGEVVFQQGAIGEAAYVLLTGKADVVVETEKNSTVLYSLGPGQMVGELAMLCDSPRSATVRARTDVTALRLNREVFFETMRQDSAFSFEVARDLGARLVQTTEELREAQA